MKTETVIAVMAIMAIITLISFVMVRLSNYNRQEKFLEGEREKYTFPNANQNEKKNK